MHQMTFGLITYQNRTANTLSRSLLTIVIFGQHCCTTTTILLHPITFINKKQLFMFI